MVACCDNADMIRGGETSARGPVMSFARLVWCPKMVVRISLPEGVNFQHVVGISIIAGIGFTMSTFIATLGFDAQPVHLQSAKSAILVGSLISAILGVLYIRFVAAKKHNTSL